MYNFTLLNARVELEGPLLSKEYSFTSLTTRVEMGVRVI